MKIYRSSPCLYHPRRAFTLIELLVVISIIATLVALINLVVDLMYFVLDPRIEYA